MAINVTSTSGDTYLNNDARQVVRNSFDIPYVVVQNETDDSVEVWSSGQETAYYFPSGDSYYRPDAVDEWIGQSFSVQISGFFSKLWVQARNFGSPVDVVLRAYIHAHMGSYGSTGIPSNISDPIAVSTNTITSNELSSTAEIKCFEFDESAYAIAGHELVFVIKVESATTINSTNAIEIWRKSSSPIYSGNACYDAGSGPVAQGGIDLWFGVGIKTVTETFSDLMDNYNDNSGPGTYQLNISWNLSGQSFTGDGGSIVAARFSLRRTGQPNGTLKCQIFAHTGTYGGGGTGTGSALATSSTVYSINSLSTSNTLYNFIFDTPFQTVNGTNYVIVLYAEGLNGSYPANVLDVFADGTSPTHDGNSVGKIAGGSWYGTTGYDTYFQVYKTYTKIDRFVELSSGSTYKPSATNISGVDAAISRSNDRIHVSYGDISGKASSVHYQYFNAYGYSNYWSTSSAETVKSDVGEEPSDNYLGTSIDVDSNAIPHMAYMLYPKISGTSTYTLAYNNRIGGSWNITDVNVWYSQGEDVSYTFELIISRGDVPFIGFRRYIPTSFYYTGAVGNGNDATSFTLTSLYTSSAAASIGCSYTIDSDETLWIAFRVSTTTVSLHGWTPSTGSWTKSYTKTVPSGTLTTLSITGLRDVLYLLYENGTDGYIYYYTFDPETETWSSSPTVLENGGTYSDISAELVHDLKLPIDGYDYPRYTQSATAYTLGSVTYTTIGSGSVNTYPHDLYGGRMVSQSFTGNGELLDYIQGNFTKVGSPTGTLQAFIYAHSGTYGTSSVPDGGFGPLASSTVVNLADVGSGIINIPFNPSERIVLENSTYYCMVFKVTGGDASNYLESRVWTPGTLLTGNYAYYESSWTANSGYDLTGRVFTIDIDYALGQHSQSFEGKTAVISGVKVLLSKSATTFPNDYVFAELYAHSGTYGTSSVPTGSRLAISNPMHESDISTTAYVKEFEFAQPVQLYANNYYVLTFSRGKSSDNSYSFRVWGDSTSPTHPGNYASVTGGVWTANSGVDLGFEIVTTNPIAFNINYTFLDSTSDVLFNFFEAIAADVTGETFYQAVSGALTTAGTIAMLPQKALAGTLTTAGTVATIGSFFRTFEGTLSTAGAVTKETTKTIAGTLTTAGTIVTSLIAFITLLGEFTSSGTLTKESTRFLAGTFTSSGTLATIASFLRFLAGTFTSSGTLAKQTAVSYAGSISPSGTVDGIKIAVQLLEGTLSFVGAVTKRTAVSYDGTLTTAGAVFKQGTRSLAGTFTSSGTIATIGSFFRTLEGTLLSAGAVTKRTAVSYDGTISPSGTIATIGSFFRTLEGTVATAGAVTKQATRSLAGTFSSAGDLFKQAQTTLAGALATAGDLATQYIPGAEIFYQTVEGTLSFVGAVTKESTRSLAGTFTTAGTIAKESTRSLAGTFTSSGTLATIGSFFRTLEGTISFVGTVDPVTVFLQLIEGTISFAGAVTKDPRKLLQGTLTTAGTVSTIASFLRTLEGTISFAGDVTKESTRSLAGTLTTAGTVATLKVFVELLQGTISFAGAVTKDPRKSLQGTISFAGAVTKQAQTTLAGTLTTAGNVFKRAARSLAGVLTTAGDLATQYIPGADVFYKTVEGTLSFVGAVTKRTAVSYDGTLTTAGAIFKQGTRSLAGTFTSSGTVATLKVFVELLQGTISFAGAIAKDPRKSLQGTFSSAGAVAKQSTRFLTGSLATAGTVSAVRTVVQFLSGVVSFTGTIAKLPQKALSGSWSGSGQISKETQTTLSGNFAGAGTVFKQTAKLFEGTLSTAGSVFKQAQATLSGTLGTAGSLIKETAVLIEGTWSGTGAIFKQFSISLEGTLTMIGTVIGIANAITVTVALTLKERSFDFALKDRATDLSLRIREFAFTLFDRRLK